MTPLADRLWGRRLRRLVTRVPFLVTTAVVVVRSPAAARVCRAGKIIELTGTAQ